MSDAIISETETQKTPARKTLRARIVAELKFFAGLAAVMLTLLTLVFGHYKIPSESMQPTLEVGDHLFVSKWAYGYSRHSLPVGLHHLPLGDGQIFARQPERGDVVVFRNPKSGIIMIKRAIGLPGDIIETINGRLIINGTAVPRALQDEFRYRDIPGPGEPSLVQSVREYVETLPGAEATHLIWERGDGLRLDNRGPFEVPEGTLFFMGDNRDNSTDSRAGAGPGFVPMNHLIGRAERIMFSFNKCADDPELRCPGRRAFNKL
jgi:signal peptidase I